MSFLGDWSDAHPVARAPQKEPEADPVYDAFSGEAKTRAARTPAAGQRRSGLRLEVDQPICRVGACPHPPGHHAGPLFIPDPSLDETLTGWTAQHLPTSREPVSFHCILCWGEIGPADDHVCRVALTLGWSS